MNPKAGNNGKVERLLGGFVPKFYFALNDLIQENVERSDKRIATMSFKDVKNEIERNFENQEDCDCQAILVDLKEEDISEMLNFLRDTGISFYMLILSS